MTQCRGQPNESIIKEPHYEEVRFLEALEYEHTETHTVSCVIENNSIAIMKGAWSLLYRKKVNWFYK